MRMQEGTRLKLDTHEVQVGVRDGKTELRVCNPTTGTFQVLFLTEAEWDQLSRARDAEVRRSYDRVHSSATREV